MVSQNRLSHGVFSSARRSWTFRRWKKHSIEAAHHFASKTDCNSTADVPSFILRTALFSSTVCFGSMECWRAMIPWKIFTGFATFQWAVSVNDFRLFWRLVKLSYNLFVSWEDCALHGISLNPLSDKILSHDTTAYWWLFWNSSSSLRTLWSDVIKLLNFSRSLTESPMGRFFQKSSWDLSTASRRK